MATNGIKVNMTSSHPGDFIHTEVIEELGLKRDEGVPDFGGSPGYAFGHAAVDAGLVRRLTDAFAGKRGSCPAVRSGLTGNCVPSGLCRAGKRHYESKIQRIPEWPRYTTF